MTAIQLEARNADLGDIKAVLDDQRARRLDVVARTAGLTGTDEGMLRVASTEQMITEDGVTPVAGDYLPTAVADEGIGARLDIPGAYLKTLRAQGRTDMWRANVNMRLHGSDRADPMDGTHLARLLRGDPGEPGVCRAFLSPKYRIMDSLDVLVATLSGVRRSGVDVHVGSCDLSERRMYVRLEAPGIAQLAPKLLEGYRSPFDGPNGRQRAGHMAGGQRGAWDLADARALAQAERMGYKPGEEPVVWAGLILANSDVGNGSRYLAPQIRVKVCRNGLTVTTEANRRVHLGAEQAAGAVNWSAETQERELALITSQVADAVAEWLTPDFLAQQVNAIETLAGAPVLRPEATVKEVAKSAGFSKAEADEILSLFVAGGQATAGGVAQAVTAYAQITESAETAFDAEGKALAMMAHAARIG